MVSPILIERLDLGHAETPRPFLACQLLGTLGGMFGE